MLAFNMNVTYEYPYRINKTTNAYRVGLRYHEYDTNFIKVFKIYMYLHKQQKHMAGCMKRACNVGISTLDYLDYLHFLHNDVIL